MAFRVVGVFRVVCFVVTRVEGLADGLAEISLVSSGVFFVDFVIENFVVRLLVERVVDFGVV